MKSSNPMLVYLGANAHKALMRQCLALNPEIRFIESAIYPERQRSLSEDGTTNEPVIVFDSSLEMGGGKIGFTQINDCNLVKTVESIMSDKHLSLLWTRFDGRTRWHNRSEVKRYEVTYSLIKSAIETCNTENPSVVVFCYEPHMLPIYIFKKVCEALGISTCTMTISPFNWRVFLEEVNVGSAGHQKKNLKDMDGETLNDSVKRFIDEKKSDYSVAKPFYEKRNIGFGMANRILYKLKANGWKPHKMILGQIALVNYQRLSTERSQFLGGKYICVFLQLQPEQTTLPDGGLFVHHLFAIQMLYSAVSTLGISLVIREHPATFESAYDLKWRPSDFYNSIKNIGPNIYFDDISTEPYSLIINSIAVSAITGTVLLEALLQGRPAIAFGKHPLKGYSAPAFVDNFVDEVELREKIAKAIVESPQSIIVDAERYLNKVYPSTFGPSEYVGNAQMSLEKLRDARYNALRQVIELLTKNCVSQDAIIS